jgi:hypothetical protein
VQDELRKARNENWFREVNERLEDRASDQSAGGRSFEIVCECDREDCTERITISFAAYESIRAEGRTFLVVAGHSDQAIERVVGSGEGYEVVEKFGAAGVLAEVENPRNGETPPDDPDW